MLMTGTTAQLAKSDSTLFSKANASAASRALQCNTARTLVAAVIMASLSACSSLSSPNSPDVVYSDTADEARTLQIPPDLTDVSNAEQFVLPGTSDAAITRNTLLPQLDSVRFVREGGQSWLEFQQTPEDLWPQLISFLRERNYLIDQTEPVAGSIVTQWRGPGVEASPRILRNLVGGDEPFTRVAFRLERAGGGARLFARSQSASPDAVQAVTDTAGDVVWPAASHSPENTNELLNAFLAYLGVEQQRARGILGDEQASAILNEAVVQRNAAGSEMLINRGFNPAFQRIRTALQSLGLTELASDAEVGRIEFMNDQTTLLIQLAPIHVSAVRASVTDTEGGRLSAEQEQALLSSIVDQMG